VFTPQTVAKIKDRDSVHQEIWFWKKLG